jgi:hypothetical protein
MNALNRMKFLPVFAAFILTIGVNAAPLVTFSGGGTNSESLFVSFSEDFTVQVKPGKTVSSFIWGITLSNSIARDIFTSTYAQGSSVNLITSQGVVLQTSNGATPITLTIPTFIFTKQNPSNYPLTLSFLDASERLFANGGSVTFSKGIMEIENNPLALTDPGNFLSQGFYVLNQQNASFELNLNNIMGGAEDGIFEIANLQVVPEPSTYALFGLGALGLGIAYRRKRA